jgi:hypothetical protein
MFRTVLPSIIRSSRLYTQHQVYVIQVRWLLSSRHEMFHLVLASMQSTNRYDIYLMPCVQSWTPDDGRKDRPKHVEWYSINSKIVHLVGFTIEIRRQGFNENINSKSMHLLVCINIIVSRCTVQKSTMYVCRSRTYEWIFVKIGLWYRVPLL